MAGVSTARGMASESRFGYSLELSRRRYFFALVAVASITWTDVGPSGFTCYAVDAVTGAAGRPGLSHVSDTLTADNLSKENRQNAPYVFFNRFNFPSVLPVLSTSTACETSAEPQSEPTTSDPSSRPGFQRLLQTVYDFFARRRRESEESVGAEKEAAEKVSQNDSAAATGSGPSLTSTECSATGSCSLYGRVLQALAEFPRRLFSDDGEAEEEEIGFLSRRRPSTRRWAAEASLDATETDPELYYGILDAGNAGTKDQEESQQTRVEATAEDEPDFSVDYSLGGARSYGKKSSRGRSQWSPSQFSRSEKHLFDISDLTEAVSHDEGRQQPPQSVVATPANVDMKKQQQEATASAVDMQNPGQVPGTSEGPALLRQQDHKDVELVDLVSLQSNSNGQSNTSFEAKSSTAAATGVQVERAQPTSGENERGNRRDSLQLVEEGLSSSSNIENSLSIGNWESTSSGISSDSDSTTENPGTSIPPPVVAETDEVLTVSAQREPEVIAEGRTSDGGERQSSEKSYFETHASSAHVGSVDDSTSIGVRSSNSIEKGRNGSSSSLVNVNASARAPSRSNPNSRSTNTMVPNSGSTLSALLPRRDAIEQSLSNTTSIQNDGRPRKPLLQNLNLLPPLAILNNAEHPNNRRRFALDGSGANNAGLKRLPPLGTLLSMPLNVEQLFRRNTSVTPAQESYAASAQKEAQPKSRRRRTSFKRKRRSPPVTLDTLREGGGLGTSFAQAVDASGAIIDVLSASRDLQEAIEALDLSSLGLPNAKSTGDRSGGRDSWEKLYSAVKAIEEIANWSAALDQAIDAGKHLRDSVASNLRFLDNGSSSPADSVKGRIVALNDVPDRGDHVGSDFKMERPSATGDWKTATAAALAAAANKAEHLQNLVEAIVSKSENLDTRSGSNSTSSQPQHALIPRSSSTGVGVMNAVERTRFLLQQQQRDSEPREAKLHGEDAHWRQQQQARGLGELLAHAALVADQVAAFLKVHADPERKVNGEYVMPFLRELYRVVRRLFELLDISISVADESMDAMQLGKLLRVYEEVVEEGKLTAIGFRSPRVPKRLGQPNVSCANKGMTCCVPAAAAGPDWRQKQQHHLFLQNSPRQECRAVFVSRSSMLCASTPYHNSTCNITHTETAAMDKYSVLLPVPAFSAAALCECEVSRKRNSEGLQTLEGNAEWTTGEIQADLIEKARKGWQYVKRLSSAGNSLARILATTLETPDTDPGYPRRRQQSQRKDHPQVAKQQQRRELQQTQRQQEELVERPFNGLADAMTKILMNEQLLKVFNSDTPASVVIPPISVRMHLPKMPKVLLPGGLQVSGLIQPTRSTKKD